jgi:hypothetical protein
MKKIVRNLSTEESRKFWHHAEEAAAEICSWPDWKRAGINTIQVRAEARTMPESATEQAPASNSPLSHPD